MCRAPHPMVDSKRGVSEVMGALLLIVVVIVAVGALASFVAVEQANAQSRASYLTNVHNENLQIVNSAFQPNATYTTQWSYANVTIRNTNTASSGLIQVKVFNSSLTYWFPSFNEVLPDGHLLDYTNGTAQEFGGKHATLIFPAKATIEISLNMAHIGFARSSSLSITLLTTAGNFFTTIYNPPTAIFSENTQQVGFLSTTRDQFELNGAQSTNGNGTIQSYMWKIDVTPDGWHQAVEGWNTPTCTPYCPESFYVSGQTYVYKPEALYPMQLTSLNESGPIRVTLTVTDSYGFTSSTEPTVVPGDPQVAPAGSLSLVSNVITGTCYYKAPGFCTGTLTVKLADIFGNSLSGQVIDFASVSGNVSSLNPAFALTNGAGEAVATVVFGEHGAAIEALSEANTALKLFQAENGNLEVTVNPPSPVIDSSQSVVLTASAAGGSEVYTSSSYAWYSGPTCSGSPIAIGNSYPTGSLTTTTTYCVQVTDSLGANATSSVIVTVDPTLLAGGITPSSPTIDTGQSVLLTSHASAGTPPYQYQWYTGASCTSPISGATGSTYSASPTLNTTYYYQVIDAAATSQCSSLDMVTVEPALVAPMISVSPAAIDSSQNSTLSTTTSFSGGTGPYTCQWLEEAPEASSYSNLGSSFSCMVGDHPTTSTGSLATAGTWHFELQVTDSASTPAVAPSLPVGVTVNQVLVAPVISASPASISPGGSSTLTTPTSFSGGTGPYTCQWLYQGPGNSSYYDLGSSFSCNVGDHPTISTGTLYTAGTWYFELQVTDNDHGTPAVVVVSVAFPVTVS